MKEHGGGTREGTTDLRFKVREKHRMGRTKVAGRGERFDADAAKVGEMEQQCMGEDVGRGRIREMG